MSSFQRAFSFLVALALAFRRSLAQHTLRGREDNKSGRELLSARRAEEVCRIFQAYQGTVGLLDDKSTPGQPFRQACPAFDVLDDVLCPGVLAVDAICALNQPHNALAVKQGYCHDLFEALEDVSNDTDGDDPPLRGECTAVCVNYVAKNRGSCCDWNC